MTLDAFRPSTSRTPVNMATALPDVVSLALNYPRFRAAIGTFRSTTQQRRPCNHSAAKSQQRWWTALRVPRVAIAYDTAVVLSVRSASRPRWDGWKVISPTPCMRASARRMWTRARILELGAAGIGSSVAEDLELGPHPTRTSCAEPAADAASPTSRSSSGLGARLSDSFLKATAGVHRQSARVATASLSDASASQTGACVAAAPAWPRTSPATVPNCGNNYMR
ncbi:hypothetical protein AURDEDRAFT_178519 [Auricularia subglabra TFB-10046 SS5]|uniref:Uncharacterized protein n=1 Tax=Auricularia subglabra (strain TFB-10046 / SS5) TaxID=717982 RepID=J0D1E2_AURST|nr:hypothetical protein AURDEDRAFT_178519 [Auricularia subglabra TFB-10046 SS5]